MPGNSGLILGDILGRSAGETCTELTLDRFRLVLAAKSGVLREFVADSFGVNCGLAVAEEGCEGRVNMGDGNGCRVEFLLESRSGDTESGCVLICGSCGFGKLADSGSSKFSMCSDAICPGLLESADLFLGDIRKSEAGVAGEAPPFNAAGMAWGVALLLF